ncbi:tRNA preQ1(34) S-adenosylmethionine ribosyltransferase-isomerase QueA [Verrucomicrobiota bacterium]
MKTSDFDYNLPLELIAQEPLPERSQSRMMVVHRDSAKFEHKHISDLPEYLEPGDLMVINDTRVIPARIFGHRSDTGGKVELLLVEQFQKSGVRSQESEGEETQVSGFIPQVSLWNCLCKAGRKVKAGMMLSLAGDKLKGEIVDVMGGGKISVKLTGDRPVLEILKDEGVTPLPPYIKRDTLHASRFTPYDKERYQTIYAKNSGAVAAPTAGLHFTQDLFEMLEKRGVSKAAVTLHVGPGTFKPVKTDSVEDHVMEQERYVISKEAVKAVNNARKANKRVMAVGTTTVRSLETVAAEHGSVVEYEGRSSLFIYPPYEFKVVDVLLTNFHLPKSSLIMMVSAFADRETILRAYAEAIEKEYRFYSYGDCMLIL